MNNKFAQRLKEIREENKLNQIEFAMRCNVQQSCVSKWERGATLPDIEMLCVICNVLHVSADYLLGIVDY